MQTEINLRKKRSITGMVSEIFYYLKVHIWNLFKILLVVVGPFYIIGSIFIGQYYGSIFAMAETATDPNLISMVLLIPAMLFMLVGGVFFQGIIIGYMKLSLTHTKNEISLQLVFAEAKQHFWEYLGAGILFGIAMIAVFFIAGLFIAVAPALGAIMMMIVMFGIFYAAIALSLFPFAIGVENTGVFAAFSRSFQLIKSNWWRTFGYYIFVSMIQGFMTGIVMMPAYIISFYKVFSSALSGGQPDIAQMGTAMSIIMPIAMFINLFFYTISGIGFGMNYFSLVEEKEEVGLREQIENMNEEKE